MSSRNAEGGPRQARPAEQLVATALKPKSTAKGKTCALVAVGQFHPPAGRRHLGVVIVSRCPGCGHLHIHRAQAVATADGSSRTGSCGIEYKLRVLPAQRMGGAA